MQQQCLSCIHWREPDRGEKWGKCRQWAVVRKSLTGRTRIHGQTYGGIKQYGTTKDRGGWIDRVERVIGNESVEDWEYLRCGGGNHCRLWTPREGDLPIDHGRYILIAS